MRNTWLVRISIPICAVFVLIGGLFAQNSSAPPIKSHEVSDDGVPVLIKHLPDWENARNRATYILNQNDLRNALGSREFFDFIEFASGTEAVTAQYDSGKLLLVEFSNPESSIDADNRIKQRLAETGQTETIPYRRIGNYSVFVFDATDNAAANALFDQIKYEKTVQWLGEDPFLIKRAERALVEGLSELFIATTLWILGGLGLSILAGVAVGFLYFRYREQQRATMETFSDAGGMTRLNLDGFTPSIAPADRLFND